jgi:hypothetical protein
MKKHTGCLLLAAAMAAPFTLAGEAISQADIDAQNAVSDAKLLSDAATAIDQWADAFLDKMGLEDFGEQDGRIFVFTSAPVSVTDLDPEYGKALVLAYERAFMAAQEDYIMMRFGRTLVEKSRSFYDDASTAAREIPVEVERAKGLGDKHLKLFEKALDVAERKLDQELIDLGTDPAELERMPVTRKKELFQDAFMKQTIQQASGEISGLVPVQTAVMKDDKGQTRVGVIAVSSAKTQQVARDIRYQRQPGVSGNGNKLRDLLPDAEEAFLGEFGTRLVYDEDGRPAIVSYGVASYIADSGEPYINQRKRDAAKNQATGNADAAIAEYVSGQLSLRSEQISGDEIAQIIEREMKPDSLSVERTIKNIVDKRSESAKSRAQIDMQGISTIKRPFFLTTNSGANLVYVVRAWKYTTLDAMREFGKEPRERLQKEQDREHKAGQHEGKVINTIDDF